MSKSYNSAKKEIQMNTCGMITLMQNKKTRTLYSLEMNKIDGKILKKSKKMITIEVRIVVTSRNKKRRRCLGKGQGTGL